MPLDYHRLRPRKVRRPDRTGRYRATVLPTRTPQFAHAGGLIACTCKRVVETAGKA